MACIYQKVGWVICGVLDITEMACQLHKLGSETRCVRDPKCWRVHLDSGEHCDTWTFGGKVCSCTQEHRLGYLVNENQTNYLN